MGIVKTGMTQSPVESDDMRASLGVRTRILVSLARLPVFQRWALGLVRRVESAMRVHSGNKMLRVLNGTSPPVVAFGPFAGMTYPIDDLDPFDSARKLLGLYEPELHDVVADICRSKYKTIVNVGAAEGYYAVGLAREIPETHVFAFEAVPAIQRMCRRTAEANHVSDRITIQGTCNVASLAHLLGEHVSGLIFCDCEGFEIELLRPDVLEGLGRFDILVELHERASCGPTVMQILRQRFSATHNVEFINQRACMRVRSHPLDRLNSIERKILLTDNRRHSVGWAWLTTRKVS